MYNINDSDGVDLIFERTQQNNYNWNERLPRIKKETEKDRETGIKFQNEITHKR